MSDQQFDEKLAAITNEMSALKEQRSGIIMEIGEKALAELSDAKELKDLKAKIDEVDEKTDSLIKQEKKLQAEKLQAEKAEKESIAMRTCIKCKALNPDDARFCEECGQELGILPREYCKNCGTMNSSELKFCGECGTKLEDA